VTGDSKGQAVKTTEPHGALFGRRYMLPAPVTAALQQVFAEPVGGVIVIEHSPNS